MPVAGTRYDAASGQSTYDDPFGGGGGGGGTQWEAAQDADGATYYFDRATGESTYDPPY